jgi:nucleoside-diphosphate-sugar epimerase
MRLLLTGATGFLGRHVVAAATCCTVTRVTRAVEALSPDELALGPGLWTRSDFERALIEARPDVVLHCAGSTHSPDTQTCFNTNAVLAAELLGAVAASSSPPRVMLIGSAAEYGVVPLDAQPVVETYQCVPRSDYAVAKYAQSLLGLAAAMRGSQVLIVRLFNPIGVGMPSRLALPSFARQLVGPEPKSILRVGDLSAQRDFLDVEEAARLLLLLAAMSHWRWPVVNLCSGRAYRIGDLLDGLIAASGAKVSVELDPTLIRFGDMPVLTGSTSRLASLGLKPQAPNFLTLFPRLLTEAKGSSRGDNTKVRTNLTES